MKKILSILLVVLAFVACEPNVGPSEPEVQYDVEMALPSASGDYYGNDYTSTYNYYIVLTNGTYDEEFNLSANSVYYVLDVYSAKAPSSLSQIQIPAGTYKFDASDSAAANTIGDYYSWYGYTDSANVYDMSFADATLVVNTDGSMDLVATIDGALHHITFNGNYSLTNLSSSNGSTGGDNGGNTGSDYMSSLTSNINLNLTGYDCYAEWYGDYYGVGYGNWSLVLAKDEGESGDYIFFDLITKGSTINDDISNTYSVYTTSLVPGVFVPGYLEEYDGDYYFAGSWYLSIDNEELYAPLAGGQIKITKSGSTHTVTFNCTDDASPAHTISGSWSGTLVIDDYSDYALLSRRAIKSHKAKRNPSSHQSRVYHSTNR